MGHNVPPDDELDDPIEEIRTLPFKESKPSPFGESLLKIASKVNELVRATNKHHGKHVRRLDTRAALAMNNKTNLFESDALRWIFNPAIVVTRPSAVWLALFTSDPGEANSVAGEPNGNGYSRILCAFTDPIIGLVSNAAECLFPTSTAAWGNITHVGVCKGGTRGVADLMYYGPLVVAANVNAANLAPRFAPGTLTISEKALFAGLSVAMQGNATLVADGTLSGGSPTTFPALSFTQPAGMNSDGTGTVMDTTYPTVTGATFTCTTLAQFNAAIAAANYGDEIVLQAGAEFLVPNNIPTKAGWLAGKYIIIRSSRNGEITKDQYAIKQAFSDNKMATITAPNQNQRCINFERAAKGWWFSGIRFRNTSAANHEDSVIDSQPWNGLDGTTANHVQYVVYDRILIPDKVGGCRRGLGMNGKYIAIIHSYIEGINDQFASDSQAIAGWNGSGPYKIYDVFAEAATENILFGGAPPEISSESPADIEIQRVRMFKRTSWITNRDQFVIKCAFEIKDAARLLMQFCTMENGTYDAQQNMVVMASVNQNNVPAHAPFNRCQDITIRFCLWKNQPAFINLGENNGSLVDVGARRIEISNNISDPVLQEAGQNAFLFQIVGNVPSVHFKHNTVQPAHSMVYGESFGGPTLDFKFDDNIIATPTTYGIFFGEAGFGSTGLNARFGAGNWSAKNNVAVNYPWDATLANAPNNNKNASSAVAIQFANLSALNVKLLASSPYKGTGTGGTDPGVDYDIFSSNMAWYQG